MAAAREFLAAGAAALLALAAWADARASFEPARAEALTLRDSGCVGCHTGIEEMHPEAKLSCTDCHGGNGEAVTRETAHVAPKRGEPADERVAALDEDLDWRRFRNPMDLRVARQTCGGCHAQEVERVHTSLHATTAGHLSDGFYEVGLLDQPGSKYAVFDTRVDGASFVRVPAFSERAPRQKLSTHFMDLTRKECAQCHLFSNGRAVRGRVGFDGDYRGEGCSACHVAYSLDGRSASADAAAVRNEPGHPARHEMTRAPTTATCTSCHNGDASIGLSFQGLAQLPPGAPGGPEIAGSTDSLRHRAFYLDDPAVAPPDVHHQRGMHCIDCHTENDAMGDGRLHGAMEQAVEIACQDCHGDFDAPAKLATERGTRLKQLAREEDGVWLTSKVDGVRHRVVQVVDVLDRSSDDYNERAAKAMTSAHGRLECYACHASWNPNFLGFHFDRNESLTQLDLLSGKRTPGRVTTQEKLFATWKSFYAGFNEAGRIAPYMTGFSTMATVRDAKGALVLDQELPVTARGLSGMTMIHHQVHTTRATARSCVECHRSSATWGMGSANFRLTRRLAFVADRRGIEAVAIDRSSLQSSMPLAKVVLPGVDALALDCDPLQGHGRTLFAAERDRGVHAIDVGDPTQPRRIGFVATVSPKALALWGKVLVCADGPAGLKLFDVADPRRPELIGRVATQDARGLALQWPHAFVADGPGGLLVVDLRDPRAPKLVGGLALDWKGGEDLSVSVSVLFQYSRPTLLGGQPADDRTQARMLCAVLDARRGLELVDATEPSALHKLWPPRYRADPPSVVRGRGPDWRALYVKSHIELAQAQGGAPTRERDLVYVLGRYDEGGNARSKLTVVDVSDPTDPDELSITNLGFETHGLALASLFQPPFLSTLAYSTGSQGAFGMDASISREPRELGALSGLTETRAIVFEEFPLDRALTEQGVAVKDVSHAPSRWLTLDEIARVLSVDADRLDLDTQVVAPQIPGATARLHLQTRDLDRSGFLDGPEYADGGGEAADVDRDGRISLRELVRLAERDGEPGDEGDGEAPMGEGPRSRAERRGVPPTLAPDGDWAMVLDTVDPSTFDADRDGALDAAEFARALFAALDLDESRTLSIDEISRLPGPTRGLRFGDAAAGALAKTFDRRGEGRVQAKDWRAPAEAFEQLDLDRDRTLVLPQRFAPRGRPAAERAPEWPARRPLVLSLPPVITRERILAAFDADRDGELTAKELKARPDVLAQGDDNGDNRLIPIELKADLDRIDNLGVDTTLDGYLERWDLDRDGRVGADELAIWPSRGP